MTIRRFGYGSKSQLLRMLSSHRNEFNRRIAEAIGTVPSINWLDFEYDGPEDKELLNATFVSEEIEKQWEEIWPTNHGKNGLNWDAVGKIGESYVLVEAKAHLQECDGSPDYRGGGKHPEKAIESIARFQKKYGIKEMDWLGGSHYQIANRLVFTDFLLEKGIDTKLVYVLFLNGYEFNTPNGEVKSVSCVSAWQEKFDCLLSEMGIKGTEAEHLIDFCYVDCNPKVLSINEVRMMLHPKFIKQVMEETGITDLSLLWPHLEEAFLRKKGTIK